jgi:hypothetical protein
MNILSKIFYKQQSKNEILSKSTKEVELKSGDNSIIFQGINPNDLSSFEYKEMQSNNVASSLSSGVIQAGSIALLNPNGLFTASVSPKLLSLFKDGTFSTIIRGKNGKILRNAGFLSANTTVFAPIVVYQILSFVTGQYYLNRINKQLSSIQKGINELIYYHHIDRVATLRSAFEYLQQLYSINSPSLEHLNALEKLEIDILKIKNEYCIYLENIDLNEILKLEKLFSDKKIIELISNYNNVNEKYFNYIKIIQNCEELLHLITIFKLMVNVKIYKNDNKRYNQMMELLDIIEKWNPQNTYLNKNNVILHDRLYKSYCNIITRASEIKFNSLDLFQINNIKSNVNNLQNSLNQNLKAHLFQIHKDIEMVHTGKIISEEINKNMDLLYAPNENKIYVKYN